MTDTTISVNLNQLHTTCQAVRLATEHGLRPGIRETDQKIHQGVPFGAHSPSGEADAARNALSHTLRRHAENSTSHLRRAEQIIAFLDHMLREYSNADSISAASFAAVQQQFDNPGGQP